MSCEDIQELISDYIDGAAAPEARGAGARAPGRLPRVPRAARPVEAHQ